MKNTYNKESFTEKVQLTLRIATYIFLIMMYGILSLVKLLAKKIPFFSKLENTLYKGMKTLDKQTPGNIPRVELIRLAIQNMKAKSNRTNVTVGGMAIGIATIVLLVSIAYGLQSLVVNRVARLEEMKQTDVSIQPGSNLLLTDDVLDVFRGFENVEMALPQISAVGKVNFNNSSTDMAVYGVTKDYLVESAIAPVVGRTFESNEMKETFEVVEESVEIDSTDLEDTILEVGWVEVEEETEDDTKLSVSKVTIPADIKDREAVVNRSFLKVLNINESEAVGKTFSVSFIATNKTLLEEQARIESTAIEYTIVGVTPDDITPLFYVPFIHLKSIGIENYSQAKVIVDKEENLEAVRTQIESNGFLSTSVVDTVAQIDNLFSTIRSVLGILGAIALFVAALGMFNTLTVSLLERTREVGLLKAMGMKSKDVRDLFLAESMIMGTTGGVLGITGGLLIGKIIELGLSIYSSIKGIGMISIVDMPISFALFIILLSFLVGVLTGFYPAKRATKISALNALRYE